MIVINKAHSHTAHSARALLGNRRLGRFGRNIFGRWRIGHLLGVNSDCSCSGGRRGGSSCSGRRFGLLGEGALCLLLCLALLLVGIQPCRLNLAVFEDGTVGGVPSFLFPVHLFNLAGQLCFLCFKSLATCRSQARLNSPILTSFAYCLVASSSASKKNCFNRLTGFLSSATTSWLLLVVACVEELIFVVVCFAFGLVFCLLCFLGCDEEGRKKGKTNRKEQKG